MVPHQRRLVWRENLADDRGRSPVFHFHRWKLLLGSTYARGVSWSTRVRDS
jgi:hypothetical protein